MASGPIGVFGGGSDAEAFGAFAPSDSFTGGSFGAPFAAPGGVPYLRPAASAGLPAFPPAPGADLENYDAEPPLLEELGVSFSHIYSKVVAVLMLNRPISADVLRDADLAGPIVFCVLLGLCMLLVR